MIVPRSNLRGARRGHPVLRILSLVLLVLAVWCLYVIAEIHAVGTHDLARPADAIAVFGAAEYEGKPSPVLRARLEHTLQLYQQHIAPIIITTGGQGDTEHSEGGVSRDYLTEHGVPLDAIIAETMSQNTQEAVEQLATIARTHHFQTIVVVSDATHLFRIREMCRAAGLTVYTSPRAWHAIPAAERMRRIQHEVLSYTAWKLHLSSLYDDE